MSFRDTRFLSGTGNFIPFNNSRTTLRLLNAASKGHEVPGWQMSVLPIGYSYSPWSAKGRVAAPQFGHKRSEEHTSELQSLMRISYAVFCLKNKMTTLQQTS